MLTFLHFAPAQPVQQQPLAQQLAKPKKDISVKSIIYPKIIHPTREAHGPKGPAR